MGKQAILRKVKGELGLAVEDTRMKGPWIGLEELGKLYRTMPEGGNK